MKKIILTGGGTAGHITPNIALIPLLQKRGYEVHYIGAKDSMEERLIRPMGVPFYTVSVGKLRRYFDPKNFSDPFRVVKGVFEARRIIKNVRPDVVFAKGGFVSVPVVTGASMAGVPAVLHESDRTPGLANKLCIPLCRRICTAFEQTKKALGEKAVCTGLPVRESLLAGDRQKGLSLCGFADQKPVLMVMGGSQGAQALNEALRAALGALLGDFQVIHLCGKGNVDETLSSLAGYCQFEYANEQLPDLFAATDIVLSRAGATALFEFAALELPVVAVPLPLGASRGDQIENAKDFCARGWLEVLPQEELTADTLLSSVKKLYENRASYRNALAQANMAGAAKRVADEIDRVAQAGKRGKHA